MGAKSFKILLLGPGGSGKSTFFKQLKILHAEGFSDNERVLYRTLIHQNGVEAMQDIIHASRELKIPFDSHEHEMRANRLLQIDVAQPLPWNPLEDMDALLGDTGFQLVMRNQFECQQSVMDSAPYWFNNVRRIYSNKYLPTDNDILRSRSPTCGIAEMTFRIENTRFSMFDVGGQRGERRKWVHCFNEVNAIMFIASLADYDQILIETREPRNSMLESLWLFKMVITEFFPDKPVILFLNKADVFSEKLKLSPMERWFPQFKGGSNLQAAVDFVDHEYLAQTKPENGRRGHSHTIYRHVTTATDTGHMQVVWNAARHAILTENMKDFGLVR